jgi:transcription initiation factor TFIID subunit TAF12
MAISTSAVTSGTITRIQYDSQPQQLRQQPEQKTQAQKEQESPAPSYNSDLNLPNDGTGASYSFLV